MANSLPSFELLDRDPLVRDAIAHLAGWHLNGPAADVTLVDFRLAHCVDEDLLAALAREEGFEGVVLLSEHGLRVAQAQARRHLANGGRFGPSSRLDEASRRVLELEWSLEDRSSLGLRLTPRERAVWALMAAGATNADVAAELSISLSTVKSHVAQIMRKLGTRKRAGVIARYFSASPL